MAEQEAGAGEAARQQCDVCHEQTAKYCCPRCDRRTCSLDCVKAHKEASGCSGKRDRTAYVGRGDFDERTFMSDYRFLEEVKLADDVAKRSKPPAPKFDMPQFLQTLMYQARRRGVQLHILSPGMEKRRTNTTRYDGRMQLLHWHLEWSFPAAGCKVANNKVHENSLMSELLKGHLVLQPGEATKHHALREYNEAALDQLTVLLRKERTPANAAEYYEIDISRPLRQQLAGKVIVEFPTFLVLLPRERADYIILPPPAAQVAAAPPPSAAPGAAAAAEAAVASAEAAAAGAQEESAAALQADVPLAAHAANGAVAPPTAQAAGSTSAPPACSSAASTEATTGALAAAAGPAAAALAAQAAS